MKPIFVILFSLLIISGCSKSDEKVAGPDRPEATGPAKDELMAVPGMPQKSKSYAPIKVVPNTDK